MKELMERYERGDVVYTKEEGELLPFSGENIPDYIRDKFRAMHQKIEEEALKEAQKDPLIDNLLDQLKREVASGKPVTK